MAHDRSLLRGWSLRNFVDHLRKAGVQRGAIGHQLLLLVIRPYKGVVRRPLTGSVLQLRYARADESDPARKQIVDAPRCERKGRLFACLMTPRRPKCVG